MGIQDLIKEEPKEVDEQSLGALGLAANKLVKAQQNVEEMERQLREAKEEERRIAEKEIPDLMDNLGFESITLNTGQKLQLKESIQCSIPAAKRPPAFRWLDEHGHGDLIKTAVSAKFGRGEKTEAQAAYTALQKMGVHSSIAESVHPGTLKAWAREELSNGRALPEEFFKVHIVRQATLK